MKKNITNGITICLFLSFAACSNADQDTKAEEAVTTTDKAATVSAAAESAAPVADLDMPITGKILETMNAGGYTYLQIDTGSSQPWVAIPQSQVKVGDEVTCNPGMAMGNFTSKTLNRTFDSIIFSSGIAGAAGGGHGGMMGGDDSFSSAVQAEGGSPMVQESPASSGGSLGAMTPYNEVKVEKAVGENSYTIEEIFAKTKELDGKTVRIQGKVVKYSPMIMGRNWIHIQDGTGDPMSNTHDLVITTTEEVQPNDVITIEGVLAFNKDFGAGYKYVAIVEEAKTLK
ncbi:MAG: DNA-binding protein [Proteobacteria bacterium]|nr:DNA-binding protein [Pseudomonadota bacterium]MBU1233219.1 DNA-binding protein [Pseudomonadota bacterium]MBU1418324.1 DNA-binding protein [Pseudomonadota bacterium]MBU1454268.1 DNA-binding protein [Pseudomonadota bacterium]